MCPRRRTSQEGPGLAGEDGLCGDAAEREHSQAPILQLLQLHVSRHCLILGQEVLAQEEIARLPVDVALPALEAQPSTIDLVDGDGGQERAHESGRHHLVVRLDRGNAPEGVTREPGPEICGHPAHGREHADAPVLELRLARQVHRQGVRDLEGIEALLAAHPAVQLLGVLQEGDGVRHPGRLRCLGAVRGAHADGDVLDEPVHGGAPPAVRLEERDGGLPEHAVLDHEPHDRDHRQPAVVPLGRLPSLQLLLADAVEKLRAEAQVEGAHAVCARLDEHLMGADEGD
mmetsp:Transcript_29262/g.87058  ORF Transcript_29262/g.87058 Transcript_29262/m.87058 type:complete len:287 (+) Transcript_29262:69-929(+)